MNFSRTLPAFFFLLLCQSLSLYVSGTDDKKNTRTDFCAIKDGEIKSIVDKQAKIWHTGGIYSDLNKNDKYKWPSEESKRKGGVSGWGSYYPKEGDKGTIVAIFSAKGNVYPYIYLLKVADCYVPINCGYLVDIDQPDIKEQSDRDWIRDSLNNLAYAAGCKFKLRHINGVWSRAGHASIDRAGEYFACDLITKGIDTVILYKHLSGNGILPFEKSFIIWIDEGKGYLKIFFHTEFNKPPRENSVTAFDAKPIFNHFFISRIDTITNDPKSEIWISHSPYFLVQLYTPGFFFRQGQTDNVLRADKTHPKSVWWNMINEKLNSMIKE